LNSIQQEKFVKKYLHKLIFFSSTSAKHENESRLPRFEKPVYRTI